MGCEMDQNQLELVRSRNENKLCVVVDMLWAANLPLQQVEGGEWRLVLWLAIIALQIERLFIWSQASAFTLFFFSLHKRLCHIVFYSGQLYDFVLKDILLGVALQWTKRTL